MSNIAVFSKMFSEKLRGFVPTRRADIIKAVNRVLVDPTNKKYYRAYLDPYWQEHPSDKTLTIFFVVPPKPPGRVFFVWVNDDRHPHDTHKNHGDDPCVKEFVRLRDAKPCLLDHYSQAEHEGSFTVTPRATGPSFVKFEKYKASVFSNVAHDTVTHFTMAITSMAQPRDLFDHYALFIEKIREHYLTHGQTFEFRVPPGDATFQTLLQSNANPSHWSHSQSGGMDIWSIR
jgi:hypothetical protein